jgi:hypothetical protein
MRSYVIGSPVLPASEAVAFEVPGSLVEPGSLADVGSVAPASVASGSVPLSSALALALPLALPLVLALVLALALALPVPAVVSSPPTPESSPTDADPLATPPVSKPHAPANPQSTSAPNVCEVCIEEVERAPAGASPTSDHGRVARTSSRT